MMSKTTRTIAFVSGSILVMALGVLCAMVYMLEYTKRDLAEGQAEISETQLQERAIAQRSKELTDTADERAALGNFSIRGSDIIQFLALIETLGVQYGTEVETVSLDVAEIEGVFDVLQIEIKTSGTETGVLHVLKSLETLPYAAHVAYAHMQAVGLESSGEWEGNFTLLVLQQKDI